MIAIDSLVQLIEAHPFAVLLPLAILEGPIVTVVAAWLMRGSFWDLGMVYMLCVLGDMLGDAGLYAIGRQAHRLSPKWRKRLRLSDERFAKVGDHFAAHGPATVAFGKLTHSAGMAVLLAAGAAHMPFWRFMGWNFLATLPKTLAFVAIGYACGAAYGAVDTWIFRASLIALALVAAGVGLFWYLHRKPTTS